MLHEYCLDLIDKAMRTKESRKILTKFWREENDKSVHYSTGFCYNATEVLFHMIGGKRKGYLPYVAGYYEQGIKCTHWWLQHKSGNILDPTRGQYGNEKPPYHLGRKCGFLTGYDLMSKRSKELYKIVRKIEDSHYER